MIVRRFWEMNGQTVPSAHHRQPTTVASCSHPRGRPSVKRLQLAFTLARGFCSDAAGETVVPAHGRHRQRLHVTPPGRPLAAHAPRPPTPDKTAAAAVSPIKPRHIRTHAGRRRAAACPTPTLLPPQSKSLASQPQRWPWKGARIRGTAAGRLPPACLSAVRSSIADCVSPVGCAVLPLPAARRCRCVPHRRRGRADVAVQHRHTRDGQ